MLVFAVLFGVFGAVLLFLLAMSLRPSTAVRGGQPLDSGNDEGELLPELISLREFLFEPDAAQSKARGAIPKPRSPYAVPQLPLAEIPAQAESSRRILETRDEARPSLRGQHLETRDEEIARLKTEQ